MKKWLVNGGIVATALGSFGIANLVGATTYSDVVTVTAVKTLVDSLATVGFGLATDVLPTLMYYGLIIGILVGLVALVVYGFRRVFRTH